MCIKNLNISIIIKNLAVKRKNYIEIIIKIVTFLKRFYFSFFERGEMRESGKHWSEIETSIRMPPIHPLTGDRTHNPGICVLTGDLLLCRMTPRQLSHTSQGDDNIYWAPPLLHTRHTTDVLSVNFRTTMKNTITPLHCWRNCSFAWTTVSLRNPKPNLVHNVVQNIYTEMIQKSELESMRKS